MSYSSISIEELVRRCSDSGEIGAWEEFVRRFHRLIAAVVLRTSSRLGNSSSETIDDLIQETYLKLCADDCRLLRDFDPRHPDAFLGYIRIVTANVVRDYFKASCAQKRGATQVHDTGECFVATAPEDSVGSPLAIERAVLIEEIQGHLNVCVEGPEQNRNMRIFWLYYRVGLSASTIAALPGVGLTTKGVESLILRITRELRERLAAPKSGILDITQKSSKGVLPLESF